MCDESQRQQDTSLRRTTILFFSTLVVLVSGTSAALCWGGKCRVRMRQSSDDTKDPVVGRGVRNDTVAEILDDAIGDASFNQHDGEVMHSNTSAQALASEWSIFRDPLRNVLPPQRITQRYALATLFFQPGEWRSVDPSWLSGENECGWFGVECDEDNLVTAIQISGIFLSQYESSFIPTDRKLSTFIGPSAPMLVPAIPSDLAILTRLRILDLSQNSIRGLLPETLSNLTLMEVFNVSGNEMEGALPNLNWPNLKSFSITGFTEGSLPEWIGQWADLEKFEITSVTFTGTLPSSMALWTNIRDIVVRENTFSGSFPTNLANLSLLEHLEVSDSFFELPFPSDVIRWPKLKVLRLENLSFNNNEIPTSLATLTDLECLSLHASNDKSAIVPIGDWPKLKELYLDGNGLSAAGGLPGKATWTNLIDYRAFSDFTGELPHYIGLWTSLETFNVRRNSLSGSIPTEFGLCTNLRYLFVEGNSLTGSIPSEIGELGSLEEFAIGQNSISGPIPNARSWTNLKFLSLDGNLLTGPIPDSVKSWTSLIGFRLRNNRCNGTLDNLLFGPHPHLTFLDVSMNHFSGPLVGEATDSINVWLPNLFSFNASFNKLTGSLPSSIARWTSIGEFYINDNQMTGTIPPVLAKTWERFSRGSFQNNAFQGENPFCSLELNDLDCGDVP